MALSALRDAFPASNLGHRATDDRANSVEVTTGLPGSGDPSPVARPNDHSGADRHVDIQPKEE
jgi:hypothetical protein